MDNDLISRSELLEHAKGGDWDGVGFSKEYVFVDDIINAPTVETDIEVVAKDAYKQGYTDGWKERFGEPNEIPQGEWDKRHTELLKYFVKCEKCGEEIMTSHKNFCPNCGADLKKGN